MGLMGCKWSSLDAPGTETPLSHSVLKLGKLPFLIFLQGIGQFCNSKLQNHLQTFKLILFWQIQFVSSLYWEANSYYPRGLIVRVFPSEVLYFIDIINLLSQTPVFNFLPAFAPSIG